MGGTRIGGLKAADGLRKSDPDFYKKLGKLGGAAGTGHAFGHGKISPSAAGKLGGRPSKSRALR